MPVIYVLIPDIALCAAVTEQLKLTAFGIVKDAPDLSVALKDGDVAAIICDEAVSDKKFFKLLRETAATKKTPILFLGKIAQEEDSNLVAESFSKPLRLGHLITRLQFHLQTAPRLRGTELHFGPYRFEPHNRQLLIEGSDGIIRLTEKETALLEYLADKESGVTRDELLTAIWGYDARIDTHTLETHIYQLRRKLDPSGQGDNWLINEEGAYRLKREDLK